MKRSLFILLLALCPLLLLTFGAFIDFLTVPPRAAPDDSELLERVSEASRATSGRLSRFGNFPQELARGDLFLGTSMPASAALGARDEVFGTFSGEWEKWSGSAADLQEYLTLLFKFKTKDLAQLRRAVDAVKSFRERFSQNLPEKGQNLLQIMMNIEKDLDDRVVLAEKRKEAEELMAEARNAYDAEQYEVCRDKCNALLTEYEAVLDQRVKLSFEVLKARAEVYAGTDRLSEIKLEEMNPVKRLAKLEAFLSTVKGVDLDTLDDADRREVDEFMKAAKSTRAEISADQKADRILKMLATLRNNPPEVLSMKMAAAMKTLDTIRAAEKEIKDSPDGGSIKMRDRLKELTKNHETLQETVRVWFAKMLPAVSSVMDDKIQEAGLKDGSVLCGYFSPVTEDGKITGYKCYPTLREYEKPTSSVGTLPAADFVSLPAAPQEKTLAAEYAGLRKKMLESVNSRGEWVDFQNRCQKMEDTLAAHRKKPGVKKTEVTFAEAVSVAKDVLETKNWDSVEKIFANR